MGKSFLTCGDYGDVVYLLPSLKLVAEQTGEQCILYARNGLRDHDPFIPRIPGLQRLIEFQPYMGGPIRPWHGEPIDYDASRFRDHGHPFAVTLAELQARFIGLEPDFTERWLLAEPALSTKGKIVIARSSRYGNPYFPWLELLRTFGDKMVFVGRLPEHEAFCREFGHVNFFYTADLYDVAQAISGSELFIGNQSSPYSIAEGLKHRRILEVSLETPDCCYSGATHCYDGGLDLHLFGRHLHTEPVDLRPRATRGESPPGGWRVTVNGASAKSYSFDMVVREIRLKLRDRVPDNLIEMVIEQSSVDMAPSPPEASIRQLRQLLERS